MTDEDREKAAGDLKVVRTIMESCAKRQQNDGIYFIIWGLLIPLATGCNYLLVYLEKWNFFGPLWAVVMLTGGSLSFLVSLRRKRRGSVTHGARVQSALWLGCCFSIVLLMAASFLSGDVKINIIMMFVAFLMANTVFISGMLSGTGILKLLSSLWWAAGIICAILPEYDAPIVLGGATFVLSFIPGLILDRRYRASLKTD